MKVLKFIIKFPSQNKEGNIISTKLTSLVALKYIKVFASWHSYICAVILSARTSRKLLCIKVTPDLHLTYSKNEGNHGVGIENEKYSLYLNFIDKTFKIYLFLFV